VTGWEAVLAYVVGPIIIAGGTWWVARWNARTAAKATEKTVVAQEKADAVTGYHTLVADLRADIERLRRDLDSLSGKVGQLETQAQEDQTMIRRLRDYAQRLRLEIQRLGGTVPEAPPGVGINGTA
jgi:uncharacterized coiled-coil protein SlyX